MKSLIVFFCLIPGVLFAQTPTTFTVHNQSIREGKNQILYSVFDENKKLLIGNVIYTCKDNKALDKTALSDLFTDTIFPQMIAAQAEDNQPEEIMTITEVETLLKEKGLLATDEKLEDLKTITEIEAAVVLDTKVVEAVK